MEDVMINIAGYEVLVSACDAEKVMSKEWFKNGTTKGYTYFAHKTPSPERKNIFLHRFIVDCPLGMYVDHVNGNTLDNRRENLRICTKAENCQNRKKSKVNTSGYKGVSWDNHYGKWVAFIFINKKNKYLGSFETAELAYKAYCEASAKYHGEFGRIA